MGILKALYISYDGITDPLGRSQILPYLKKLTQEGVNIFLLSFEKDIERKRDFESKDFRKELDSFNISWMPLRFHRGIILFKIWDMILGIWFAVMAIYKNRIRLIHSRGYPPAFIALCLKRIFPLRFIFDIRGLWIDERLDAGLLLKGSIKYRLARWFERKMLLAADEIIVLTQALKDKLTQLPYLRERFDSITVIPTCVDLKLFYPADSLEEVNVLLKDKFVVSYFGSIGTYYNFSAVLDFFKVLSGIFRNSYLLVMSNSTRVFTEKIIHTKGISSDRYYLGSVSYQDVPPWLSASDVSVIFYNRSYSKEGCCPTKLGESLSCGVPVVINDGIGDCSSIVKKKDVGIIVKDFTEASYFRAAEELAQLLKDRKALSRRCRIVAEEVFSLDEGVKRYIEIYKRL